MNGWNTRSNRHRCVCALPGNGTFPFVACLSIVLIWTILSFRSQCAFGLRAMCLLQHSHFPVSHRRRGGECWRRKGKFSLSFCKYSDTSLVSNPFSLHVSSLMACSISHFGLLSVSFISSALAWCHSEFSWNCEPWQKYKSLYWFKGIRVSTVRVFDIASTLEFVTINRLLRVKYSDFFCCCCCCSYASLSHQKHIFQSYDSVFFIHFLYPFYLVKHECSYFEGTRKSFHRLICVYIVFTVMPQAISFFAGIYAQCQADHFEEK